MSVKYDQDTRAKAIRLVSGSTEIRELRRRNRELEQTVEVLRAASALFAREHDALRH